MLHNILNHITNQSLVEKKKLLALLIDPDDLVDDNHAIDLVHSAIENQVDYLFFGGSLIFSDKSSHYLKLIKGASSIPVIIFPANAAHLIPGADAVLFLSLISGRNPELLIGNHVIAAPVIKNLNLECLPTGYLLVGENSGTTAQYMSNTQPIPYNKPDIAAATALAGQYLGLQLIYMDAGSGAIQSISPEMTAMVKKTIDVPLVIGGGIKTVSTAEKLYQAGADMLVIGNGAFENGLLIQEIANLKKKISDGNCTTVNQR
jgi:phosphoglycerol geranylgeranyltransferase